LALDSFRHRSISSGGGGGGTAAYQAVDEAVVDTAIAATSIRWMGEEYDDEEEGTSLLLITVLSIALCVDYDTALAVARSEIM